MEETLQNKNFISNFAPSNFSELKFQNYTEFKNWIILNSHNPQAIEYALSIINHYRAQETRLQEKNSAWTLWPWIMQKESYLAENELVCNQQLATLLHLDSACAKLIVNHATKHQFTQINLSALRTIDELTAKELAQFSGDLNLSGFKELNPQVAEALSHNNACIRLDGLEKLQGSIIPLVRRRLPHGSLIQPSLSLNGLQHVDSTDGQFLKEVHGHLYLNGLSNLTIAQAEILISRKGEPSLLLGMLFLDKWKPTPAVLKVFNSYKGELSLGAYCPNDNELDELCEGWTSTSKHKREGLSLPSVTNLSQLHAIRLSKLPIKKLYLNGITDLNKDLVEYLGSMSLEYLFLDGVTQASDDLIKELVESQNKNLAGLSMLKLNLLPKLKAELKLHRKLHKLFKTKVFA